jgi:hypothetical protein
MPGLLWVMLMLGTLMVATQLSLAGAPLAAAAPLADPSDSTAAPASTVSVARMCSPR